MNVIVSYLFSLLLQFKLRAKFKLLLMILVYLVTKYMLIFIYFISRNLYLNHNKKCNCTLSIFPSFNLNFAPNPHSEHIN